MTDPRSEPIARARVCAVVAGTIAASTAGICAETDIRGQYAIHGLPSESYLVTAARPGYVTGSARGGQPVDLLGGSVSTEVDLVLQPGGAQVTGVVMDAIGGPVPHATIRAERVATPRLAVDLEADDLGRFAFWFPPGPLVLAAEAAEYAPTRWNGPAPSVDVRLVLTPGATIRGLVVSAEPGGPVPNVEVRAVPTRNPSTTLFRSSTSGDEGRFDIQGLEPGLYILIATGEGWSGELGQPIQLGLGSTVENVRILVGPAARVTGRVLLADTLRPCEQGSVTLAPLDPGERPGPRPVRPHGRPSFTRNIGAEGVVHFPAVARGHYGVGVSCSNTLPRDGPTTLDIGSSAVDDLTWTVSSALSATVLAVNERGQPMPGIVVLLKTPQGPVLRGRTNDAGRYEVAGVLSAGSYEVSAQPPFEAEGVRIELRDGDAPRTVTLRVSGTASIEARVREPGGRPVDGLAVFAMRQSTPSADEAATPAGAGRPAAAAAPPGMNAFSATPLGEGRYWIAPLKAGRYEIRADDGANRTVHAFYDLAVGQALEASLEIERAVQIHGHVVDEQGAPVPDAWVSVSAVGRDQNPSLLPPTLAAGARVLTDQEGRFVVDRLAGGDTTYAVRVEQPAGGAAVKTGVQADDSDVVIALRSAGSLAGNVMGDCGESASPILVRAVSLETGQTATQELSGPGEPFRMSLASGHVRLMAICQSGSGHAQLTAEVASNQEVAGLRLVLGASPPGVQRVP